MPQPDRTRVGPLLAPVFTSFMRSHYLVAIFFVSLLASAIGAQQLPLPDMERVLLPITVIDAPGAFGSSWSSEGSQFRDVPPEHSPFILPGCESPCDDSGGPTSQHTFGIAFLKTRLGETSGSIMYIERTFSADVSLALHLREASTGETVELPVVRERDFFSHRFQILDIPNPTSGKRAMLRVYGIDPAVLGQVEVRVFVEGAEQLVSDNIYDLRVVQRIYSNPAGTYSVPV
ncbi:MAG: hypothetical protein ACRD3J_02710, partial [Thermoanaerobaculia bacterium]